MGVVAIKELDYVMNIRVVQEESEMLKTKEYLISNDFNNKHFHSVVVAPGSRNVIII